MKKKIHLTTRFLNITFITEQKQYMEMHTLKLQLNKIVYE